MNINHLKYAVEVARTGSITKAAGNLYMSQPNLSRAVKELEDSIGIVIFKRTPQGLVATKEGEGFLSKAYEVVEKIVEIESTYTSPKPQKPQFNISVPRAGYISQAFVKLTRELDISQGIQINYKETNALKAINNILYGNYNLGIIRYPKIYEKNFSRFLKEKNLGYQVVWEFEMLAAMSKEHPLAKKKVVRKKDLEAYLQIAYGDPYVPFMQAQEMKKPENPAVDKYIYIYERGSQFDILHGEPYAYMWVSPVPVIILNQYELAQRKVENSGETHIDLMIFHKNYKFTSLDDIFLRELYKSRDEVKQI